MNSQNNVVNLLNTDPLAKELLQSNIPVRMAYTGTDGFPRVVPLGFYWMVRSFSCVQQPTHQRYVRWKPTPK